jgi:hypothetical protein
MSIRRESRQEAYDVIVIGSGLGGVPLPVSWTREGDIKIAPPPSIVDPNVTERSCFISHAAIAAVRAATGV